jgi:CAAX protease family protein
VTPEPRNPFWTYQDLVLFAGLAVASLLAGGLLVKGVIAVAGIHIARKAFELLPAQLAGYLFMFVALGLIFRVQYGRPFWRSLGFVRPRASLLRIVTIGYVLAFAIALLGGLIRAPELQAPMKELFSDRSSLLFAMIVGVTVAPVCEELIFRGLMQPLFVRSLGVVPGILLAAAAFGLMHVPQYGNSWKHGILITLAGAAFGWMRETSESTLGSALMHAAYNFALFTGILFAGKDIPKTW